MARFVPMTAQPTSPDRSTATRTNRLAGAALLLSGSFVASRVLGLLRNVLIADVFGNSRAVEAYFAAFRVPDTIYMLVSGGALTSAFLPVFAGLLERHDERRAWRTANTVLTTVFIVLAILALIGEITAPWIMSALVSGFTPSERDLTIGLTRIMLLQPIFLGVQAIVTAILQSYNRFTLTAVAPLIYTLASIVGVLLGSAYGVVALAWSVPVGAVLYLLVQVPGLRPEFRFVRLQLDWHFPEVREILRLLGPRLIGLAAFQVMLLITLFLAASLPQGNVAAINYSWLLIAFPQAALGTAAATAIFPTLSRLGEANNAAEVRRTVYRALSLVLFLAIPAAVGLLVLRRPIVNLLYNHGHWTFMATEQTAFALLFYALALPSLAAIEVLPRVFYALKNTATPVRIAVVTVTLDAVLSILFVHIFPRASGQGGLALASAIANGIQAVWLLLALERMLGNEGRSMLTRAVQDASIAALVMGLVLYITLDPMTALLPQRGLGVLITVIVELALGTGIFGGTAYVLHAPQLQALRAFARRGK